MNPDWRPKFDSIYHGDWPHPPGDGVGIRLTRMRTGEFPQSAEWRDVITAHGCPPDLAERIICDLITHGSRDTTVLHYINFDQLALDLAAVGVKLFIIPPRGYKAPC